MVETIVPGDNVTITVKGFDVKLEKSAVLSNKNADVIRIVTFNSDYDNITFEQTADLANSAISITPYGLMIIPLTNAEVTDGVAIAIPVKCCNKNYTITIPSGDWDDVMSEEGYSVTAHFDGGGVTPN